MRIQHLVVVAEQFFRHSFELGYSTEGNIYRCQIRDADSISGAPEASLTCTPAGTALLIQGDCRNLDPDTSYLYDVEEDGSTIISGTVKAIRKVTQ